MMRVTRLILILSVLCLIIMPRLVSAQTISEEARRHMARGQAAVEIAKSAEEYGSAIREFQEASRLAPDWPDPYKNLANLQEKTGKLKEAVVSLKEYLRLAPNAPDAAKIQEQIYKLEYKAEQVLSVTEIIDVLVSLSDEKIWQVEGDCTKGTIKFRYNEFKRDKYVSTMTAQSPPTWNPWYDSELVKGPAFKYLFNTAKYAQGECAVDSICCDDKCLIWEVREMEVVSKTLVKVKQKVMKKVPRGRPEDGIVDHTLECTYRKK